MSRQDEKHKCVECGEVFDSQNRRDDHYLEQHAKGYEKAEAEGHVSEGEYPVPT